MKMIATLIVVLIVAGLVATVPLANVNGSGLSRGDIDTSPEALCLNYGDELDMRDLCNWINICDDTGEVNSTHEFCTGEAVSNPPGPGGCPEGFHSVDDDESGLCYTNAKGCEYEGYIFRPDNKSCGEILDVCRNYPEQKECKVTINLGIPYNEAPWNECESSVPDFCIEPFRESGYLYNGTLDAGTDLNCHDVNMTDFRVTVQDRHNFDRDWDGIGCEKEDE
jgi:hypothetical protein